jgi:hypothetical protein
MAVYLSKDWTRTTDTITATHASITQLNTRLDNMGHY